VQQRRVLIHQNFNPSNQSMRLKNMSVPLARLIALEFGHTEAFYFKDHDKTMRLNFFPIILISAALKFAGNILKQLMIPDINFTYSVMKAYIAIHVFLPCIIQCLSYLNQQSGFPPRRMSNTCAKASIRQDVFIS